MGRADIITLKAAIDLSSDNAILEIAGDLDLKMSCQDGKLVVYLDGEDISEQIRLPLVNENISRISEIPEVRSIMVLKQRELAQDGAVVEGRDIGTVVFPDSKHKFYIDADFDLRVDRRYKEMKEKGLNLSREEVRADLSKRDYNDKSRRYGALIKADDALVIDTTGLTIEQVLEKIASCLKDRDGSE